MLNRSEKLLLAATAGLVLLGGWIVATRGPGKEDSPPKPEVNSASALDHPALRSMIDRLDGLFQKRFQTIQDQRFGESRLVRMEDLWTHPLWRNDPAVGGIAAQLNRKGVVAYFQTVALMRGTNSWGTPAPRLYELTARNGFPVRTKTRDDAQKAFSANPGEFRDGTIRLADYHPSLGMPIPITPPAAAKTGAVVQSPSPTPPGIPTYPQLRSGIDESVEALTSSSSHTFRAGEWEVLARPIRANGKCVSCHQGADGRRARPGDTLGLALYMVKASQPDQQFAAQAPSLKAIR